MALLRSGSHRTGICAEASGDHDDNGDRYYLEDDRFGHYQKRSDKGYQRAPARSTQIPTKPKLQYLPNRLLPGITDASIYSCHDTSPENAKLGTVQIAPPGWRAAGTCILRRHLDRFLHVAGDETRTGLVPLRPREPDR